MSTELPADGSGESAVAAVLNLAGGILQWRLNAKLMKVPISWLRDYVDVDISPKELAHKLTMAGVEVGEIIEIGDWNECFVAQVVSVRPHPGAGGAGRG